MPNLRHLTISRSLPAFSARLWSFTVLLSEYNLDGSVVQNPEVAGVVSLSALTPNHSQPEESQRLR